MLVPRRNQGWLKAWLVNWAGGWEQRFTLTVSGCSIGFHRYRCILCGIARSAAIGNVGLPGASSASYPRSVLRHFE